MGEVVVVVGLDQLVGEGADQSEQKEADQVLHYEHASFLTIKIIVGNIPAKSYTLNSDPRRLFPPQNASLALST